MAGSEDTYVGASLASSEVGLIKVVDTLVVGSEDYMVDVEDVSASTSNALNKETI